LHTDASHSSLAFGGKTGGIPVQRISALVLVGFLSAASSVRADVPDKPAAKKDETSQPAFAAEFRALKKDVDAKLDKLYDTAEKEYEAAETEDERGAVQKRITEAAGKIQTPAAERAMTLVRRHAADPAAVEALIWVAQRGRVLTLGEEALAALAKHHLTHKLTIDLAYRSKRGLMKWTEPLLRSQLASPDLTKADRPRVLLALATVRQVQSAYPGMLGQMTVEQLFEMDGIYGAETVAGFRKIDVAAAEAEAIKLFNELGKKHGIERLFGGLTYGGVAKSSVFEIEHLSLGKTAPDICGEDTDRVKFKLSDYRGRVVLLSFWGSWCDPCMALVLHEREIVARLKDKPFAIVGVNSDTDKAKLKEATGKAMITWRSFWCGAEGIEGEIPSAWNVSGWPTIYVLDQHGVIRAKNVAGKALDDVIDKLIRDAEAKK